MANLTRAPWRWADGWRLYTPDDSGEVDEKYLDLGLYGADGAAIIPLRVDHYETELDGAPGTYLREPDRRLIAAAPDLLAAIPVRNV